MTSVEVSALRYQFHLSVDDAIMELGWCSREEWVKIESGHAPVPPRLQKTLAILSELFCELFDEAKAFYADASEPQRIRYYKMYADFEVDVPHASIIAWRFHQALCHSLVLMPHIKLIEHGTNGSDCPLNKSVLAETYALSEALVSDD